jgi:hypothetical protein
MCKIDLLVVANGEVLAVVSSDRNFTIWMLFNVEVTIVSVLVEIVVGMQMAFFSDEVATVV